MSLLRAAGLIALLSLASKFVGLFRDQVIAYYCGLSAVTDAYQAASLIPAQFALVMLGGLNGPFHSAVVSTLSRAFENKDGKTYGRVLTTAILAAILGMGTISILLFVFAPQIIQIWGLPSVTAHLAILQLRIMAPIFVISGLIGICYGVLSIRHSFITPSLSPIMASLGVIISLVLFAGSNAHHPDPINLARALAWGTLIGGVGQLLLQFIPLLGFFRNLHLEVRWNDPDLFNFLNLLLPAMLSSTIGQINVFIIQFFASNLKQGSVAAFRFGNLLIQLPLGILLTALLVPLLPVLSSAAGQSDNFASLKHRLNQGLRPILMLTLPITLLLIFFGYFAISFLFERGQFNADDTWLTYQVLVFLTASITVYAIRDLLIRVYYALGDSRTPFMSSFVTIATMILLAWWLSDSMDIGGIALASSAAAALNFVVLAILLHWRIGPWMNRESWLHLGKTLLASVPMLVLGAWSMQNLLFQIGQGQRWLSFAESAAAGLMLSLVYLLLLILMRDQEVWQLLRPLQRRLFRKA